MSYRIKITFPEGVTMEDLARGEQYIDAGPDNPPPGSISHEREIVNGQIVIMEEWESKEAQQAFMQAQLVNAMQQANLPAPTIEEL